LLVGRHIRDGNVHSELSIKQSLRGSAVSRINIAVGARRTGRGEGLISPQQPLLAEVEQCWAEWPAGEHAARVRLQRRSTALDQSVSGLRRVPVRHRSQLAGPTADHMVHITGYTPPSLTTLFRPRWVYTFGRCLRARVSFSCATVWSVWAQT